MKKWIFIFILILLWAPRIENKLKLWNFGELSGVYEGTLYPKFNLRDWFNGWFQTEFDNYQSQNFGFRNLLIRLYNQIDFTFFNKSHYNVVAGKEGYLFQENYLTDITGQSFIGKNEMKDLIKNLHFIENYLSSQGKLVVTILAPGKSYFFKEYIPDYYTKRIKSPRNYEAILDYGKQENLNLLDLNKWFLQIKDTSKLPLFPKQGIHWNYYGMALCVDTITKYIESKVNTNIPDFTWTLEFPDKLRGTDYDLGDLLNIAFRLPYNKMPYPKFDVKVDSTKKKLKILTIGDSFYWSIFNEGLFSKMFDDETFYYYCNTINPKGSRASDSPADLNFIKEIEKYDLVLLLQSSANYNNPGVNFVQLFMKEFDRRNEFRQKAKSVIAANQGLSNRVNELSLQNKITVDSAAAIIADSLAEFKINEISKIKIEMRNNHDWLEQIKVKSDSWGITLEDAMQKDAEWMYSQRGNIF